MALFDTVLRAQDKDEANQLALIKLFAPLLKKYAFKLNTEDAYEVLVGDFIQVFMTFDMKNMHNRTDGALVNYFAKTIYNSYAAHLKKHIKEAGRTILYDDLSDTQSYYVQEKFAVSDDLFAVDYSDFFSVLTDREREVLTAILVDGNSAAYVACQFGVSRQNINQIKSKALRKLRDREVKWSK